HLRLADAHELVVAAGEVGAVGEAVAVVVDAVAARDVVGLAAAAELHDGLAVAVAAVELAVLVVVDAVGAGLGRVLRLETRDQWDLLPAEAAHQAVGVLAVDAPVLVVVASVRAGDLVALLARARRRDVVEAETARRDQRASQEQEEEVTKALHRCVSGGPCQLPWPRKHSARSLP